MSYFIGNVLDNNINNEKNQSESFDITDEEAEAMNLENVPICVEHEDDMNVGEIKKSWVDDGKLYVMGKINDNTLKEKFAKHAINEKLYSGLSLHHKFVKYSDGSSKKTPVEISLCNSPRRRNCNINFFNQIKEETKTTDYIYKNDKSQTIEKKEGKKKMSDNAKTDEPQTKPMEEVKTEQPPSEAQSPAEEGFGMSQEKMAQMMIEMQKKIDASEARYADLNAMKNKSETDLKILQQQISEEKQKVREKHIKATDALGKAVLERWQNSLGKAMDGTNIGNSMRTLQEKYPEETKAIFEIAHKASSKYEELEQELKLRKEQFERANLEERFRNIVNKQTPVVATTSVNAAPVEVVSESFRCSKKQRTEEPKNDKGTGGTDAAVWAKMLQENTYGGSLSDTMGELSKINQDRRMFSYTYNR